MRRAVTIAGFFAVAACDGLPAPAPESAPSVVAAPFSVSGQQFTLRGDVRIATCDGLGGTTYRAVNSDFSEVRGMPAETCAGLTGPSYDDCVDSVSTLTAQVSVNAGNTSVAGDEFYAAEPNQFVLDGTTQIPVTWRLSYIGSGGNGPLFYYQGSTRYLYLSKPLAPWVFQAPSTPGATHLLPLVSENMASYRLRLEYTPTLRDGFGVLLPSDKVVGLIFYIYLDDGTASPARQVLHRFDYTCPTAGCTSDPASVDIDTAAAVNRFLNIPASADGTSPQRVVAELPISPNSSGDYLGLSYRLRLTALLGDGVSIVLQDLALSQPTVAPCAEVEQTIVLTRPPSELNGTMVLRRDLGFPASPYVRAYSPTVYDTTGARYYPVNLGGQPSYTPVADPETPFAFRWLGLPTGTYRLEAPYVSTAYASLLYGHALVTYPGRNEFTYRSNFYNAMYRFPMRGSSTPDETFPLTVADTNNDGAADLPVTLTVAEDMAYLEGNVTLVGCVTPADYTAGAAEITGASSRGVNSRTRGFARGLFLQGTNGYLVAASEGGWLERRYFLQLDQGTETRTLLIQPDLPQSYSLTAGWSQKATAGERTYASTEITLTMSARDELGNLIPSRNPLLEINDEADDGLGEFRDPGTSDLLGKYYSRSARADNVAVLEHELTVVGLSSSTPTTLQPSVEVLGASGWIRTDLPTLTVPAAAVTEGCAAICVNQATGETYTDDGQSPQITLPPPIVVTAGASSVLVTVTVTDQLEVTVTANGVPMTAGPGANQYTATVPLTSATTSIAITAIDQCNKTSSDAIAVTFAPDLCADMSFDMCMESEPGSVFWVDLVRPTDSAVCRLRCESAAPGAAITCDSTPICPD